MRVTEGLLVDKYLYNNERIASKKMKTQMQLATNSKINTISDDLTGALESINLFSLVQKNNSYVKNSENSYDFMDSSLKALDASTNEIQKIIAKAVDSENPINVGNLATMAQSVKDSLTVIVNNINAKHNDMYLFGGTNYSADPVTIDADGKAVVSALDHSGEVKVQLSQNTKETMNIPGSQVFDTGVFDAINDIIDSLASGNAVSQAQKDALNDSYNELLSIQSLGGEKLNRLDDMKSILNYSTDNYNELLSKKQGVDPAKLYIELQEQDYLLQVTYKLLGDAFSKSAFDYL